ncbi:MAG: NERD domain-containing protein [Gammaproteobacteria bacterium]|nr:NERD domain-containing protein [Gammaproteobacteria bacterium]
MSEIIAFIESNIELTIYGGGVVLVLLLFLVFFLRYRHKTATRRRINASILSIGGQAVENTEFADDVDGNVHVDFLVYSKGRLIVLNVQDYPGMIFGGEKIDQWTQMFGGNSFKFTNPLDYSRVCVQVVKQRFPNIKVFGQVVFSHHGDFPKGIPEGVSRLDDLMSDIEKIPVIEGDHEAGLIEWQGFIESISTNKVTRVYEMQ